MTDQELEPRLSAIEQDIADIKEAISSMGGVETAADTDLRAYLEQQVAILQQADADLKSLINTNTTAISALEAKAHTLELEGTTLKITI